MNTEQTSENIFTYSYLYKLALVRWKHKKITVVTWITSFAGSIFTFTLKTSKENEENRIVHYSSY